MNRLPAWLYALLPAFYVASGCVALYSQAESDISRLCAGLLVLTGTLVSRLRRDPCCGGAAGEG